MDDKKLFIWDLNKFSSRYETKTCSPQSGDLSDETELVKIASLIRPYPTSPVFTTDVGQFTAQWMLGLSPVNSKQQPYRGELGGAGGARGVSEANDKDEKDEKWNFHLDLVGTQVVKSDKSSSEQPTPTTANIKIKVRCQLFLVGAKADDETCNEYSCPAKTFEFGPHRTSGKLEWPHNAGSMKECIDKLNASDSEDDDDDDEHEDAADLIDVIHNWVNPTEDILRLRAYLDLIGIERDLETLSADLGSDLGQGLNSGEYSDIIVKCGSASFPAHKFILSTRSPVFKRMLQAEMKEATSGEVSIEDFEPLIIKHLLKFLYTAKVEFGEMDLDQIIGLIGAADKYELCELKYCCFQELVTNMDKGSCGKLAVAAHLHGAEPRHKNQIYDFFAERWKELGGTEEFHELVKAYPEAFLKPLKRKTN